MRAEDIMAMNPYVVRGVQRLNIDMKEFTSAMGNGNMVLAAICLADLNEGLGILGSYINLATSFEPPTDQQLDNMAIYLHNRHDEAGVSVDPDAPT